MPAFPNRRRRACLLALFGAVTPFLLGSAWAAEDQKSQSEVCAKVQNDAKRLECYDLIYRKSSATTQPEKTDWIVQEERSKIDDSTNVFLMLKSIDRIRNQYNTRVHLDLVITCQEMKTSFYVVFGGYFMSSHNDRGVINYRVDKNPAKKKTFIASNDHKALGLWFGAPPFIKELFGGSTLLVRATPYSDNSVTAEFNITGIENAIKPLRTACRW